MFIHLAFAVLLATPAQTEPSSPAQQRAAARRAQREAKATDAAYKDSHLDVAHRQLKRGESAPVQGADDDLHFDRKGKPHVTEPKYPGLRLRKPKNTTPR
jgi:lysophospholipase L1-like esterase